jgi:hypothetical protein
MRLHFYGGRGPIRVHHFCYRRRVRSIVPCRSCGGMFKIIVDLLVCVGLHGTDTVGTDSIKSTVNKYFLIKNGFDR